MKIYHDFYGCQAVMQVYKNGTARLTVRDSHTNLIHAKNYKTERGARIAMGHFSDGWKQKTTT